MNRPFLLFAALLLVCTSAQAQPPFCLVNHSSWREIKLYYPGTDTLKDCQVSLPVNTGELVLAGKLDADFQDLRITDNDCQHVPFYLDSLATSTVNTLWIRVAEIPGGDTVRLWMFYNNPASADSRVSGDSTFYFFDDFETGLVDPDKWQAIGGYATLEVVDGALTYASNGANPGPRFKFVRTAESFDDEVALDFRAKVSNSNGFGFSSTNDTISRILFRQAGFGFDTLNQVALMLDTTSNGFQVEGFYPFIRFPRNQFNHAQIHAGIQDSLLTFSWFANLDDTSNTQNPYQLTQVKMSGFHFILSSFINGAVSLDYLKVRHPMGDSVGAFVGPEFSGIRNDNMFEAFPRQGVTISPNPGRNKFLLSDLPIGELHVRLVDLQGRILVEKNLGGRLGGEMILEIPAIAEGTYWLLLTKDGVPFAREAVMIRQ